MRKHVYQSVNFGKKLLFISTFKCHMHKPGQGDKTKQARLGHTLVWPLQTRTEQTNPGSVTYDRRKRPRPKRQTEQMQTVTKQTQTITKQTQTRTNWPRTEQNKKTQAKPEHTRPDWPRPDQNKGTQSRPEHTRPRPEQTDPDQSRINGLSPGQNTRPKPDQNSDSDPGKTRPH